MNIIIIGAKSQDSLESNLCEAFEHRGDKCVVLDIHDNRVYKTKVGNQLDILLRRFSDKYDRELFSSLAKKTCDYNPDLVVCVYRFVHPMFVEYVKDNSHAKIIHVNPDALTTFEYQQVFASSYDAWFTKDPYIARFMRDNMKLNAIFYNEAFNVRVHQRPTMPKRQAEEEDDTDVMTYGTIYPYRANMLKLVIGEGIRLKIYGTRPNRFYDSTLDSCFQNRYITGIEKARVLYGSKIVFNQMHYAEIESLNNRYFEVNGVGAFQLSDYRPILNEVLPTTVSPDQVSFKGIDDGIDKIKYYLAHPLERYEIADKIYAHFMEYYTYDHMIEHILQNI